jgi:hypothetical protein
MITIRRSKGRGTRRWSVLFEGYVVKERLTKGEARALQLELEPMKEIIRQIVSRELEAVVRAAQLRLSNWSPGTLDIASAA